MLGYLLLAFLGGLGVGYVIFYFRYENKDVVDELRNNLKEANKEVRHLGEEYEEFSQQNIILKSKVQELLDKNDDLSRVVSELSKYYYHIKKASEKTSDLAKFLQTPDPLVEEKMKNVIKESREKDDEKHGHDKMKDFF